MAARLNTEQELGKNLLIFSSHLSCCANNDSRQYDADEFVAFMREWIQTGNGPFALESETPFIHVGDFNLVGYRQQLTTLTNGDIYDETTFGSDFPLDWDSTALSDVFSVQTAERMGYTWRRDYSSFSPGKLDYILYTDSVIDTAKHFILNTLTMSAEDLSANNLESGDTYNASDHMPRVLDIASVHSLYAEQESAIPGKFIQYPPYPNPFNSFVKIRFSFPEGIIHELPLQIRIYSITGRLMETLPIENKRGGLQEIQWNASENSSGVYFAEISDGNHREIRKLIYLK
jgi:endonuclease/exonuclease/phosphatase family metal-dependent hydrolase